MILAHAQFVLRNMETVGRGPDSAIASGSASATGVSLAVAPPVAPPAVLQFYVKLQNFLLQ